MARRDWMKDCLSDVATKGGAPVSAQDLKTGCCDFCVQPECTRSLFGTSKFEQRVSTWKERLFTQVPRMDQNDPRFADISAKGFIIIPPEALTAKSSGAWLDPRDFKSSSVSVPDTVPVSESQPTEKSPTAQVEQKPTTPSAPQESKPASLPREVVLINTPMQRGIMLAGAPTSTPRPQRDQWDAPQPTKPGEKVVSRGATVRFGVQGNDAESENKGDPK